MEQPVQRDVVEAARDGDHEAFEALAMAVGGRLYAIAYLILRDRQRAEDAVQEALVHAWRELPRLRDADASTRGSIGSWSTPAPMKAGTSVAGRRRSG